DSIGMRPGTEVAPGVYEVVLAVDTANLIRVEPTGDPRPAPATIFLGPGETLGPTIALRPIAAVKARTIDENGQLFAGSLDLSWSDERLDPDEAESRSRILHGRPFTVALRGGRLETAGVPVGVSGLSFRRTTSEAVATRGETMQPGTNDLGVVQLTERRRLEGSVSLPTGQPAAGARVALVPISEADHYPLRPRRSAGRLQEIEVGPDGRFAIDGLPIDLDESLALTVRLDGYLDAIEFPIDVERTNREFRLVLGNELEIVAGYRRSPIPKDATFELSYLSTDDNEPEVILGEWNGGESLRSFDVRPGTYRLRWGPREPFPGIPALESRVFVGSGSVQRLALQVDVDGFGGTADFNGHPLELGWIITTDDPNDPSRLRVGRVRDGRYDAMVVGGAGTVFVTLVPERDPLPVVDFATGQGRPIEISRTARSGSAAVPIYYEAYDVILRVPSGADPANHVNVTPDHYSWDGEEWEARTGSPIDVISDEIRFSLMRPGSYHFEISGGSGSRWRATRTAIVDDQDVEILISR
ncbi:MAG: carboxypeptidase regulatory-like domain-containing protein, partial [Planctomycetes bacterium]|nr:carboxypeptidase regulatory-like domain-containing protein [Planctomycetota bacterium]